MDREQRQQRGERRKGKREEEEPPRGPATLGQRAGTVMRCPMGVRKARTVSEDRGDWGATKQRQRQPAARTDVSEEVKYYSKLHQRARRRPSLNPSSSTSSNCTRCSTYVNDPDSSPRKEGKTRLADTDQHLAVYSLVLVGGKKSPKKQKKCRIFQDSRTQRRRPTPRSLRQDAISLS